MTTHDTAGDTLDIAAFTFRTDGDGRHLLTHRTGASTTRISPIDAKLLRDWCDRIVTEAIDAGRRA